MSTPATTAMLTSCAKPSTGLSAPDHPSLGHNPGDLADKASQWQHGYALAKQTDLKSGTLYPILIRLADRGLVEACWQDEPQPGRPRRHLYRLTTDGLAAAALAGAAEPGSRPSGPRRPRCRLDGGGWPGWPAACGLSPGRF